MNGNINYRRIGIATVLGAVFGIICVYGTMTSVQLSSVILATVLYDRILLGVVIGVAYGLNIHPIIRGGALFMGAGIVYGVVIDLISTKFSKFHFPNEKL